ncbi:MAG TPA: DUF885 domain-containing protein, partial [Xanthomonadaceae bacterium]|nr:DUF885 domain-containing protein [Xanthomonadaceae bacterium]
MHKPILVLAIAAALCAGASSTSAFAQDAAASAQAMQAAPMSAKAAQLDKLYTDFWEASLKLNPIQATFVGDPRYNDQLPNFLAKDYIDETNRFNAEWLAKAKAIGSDGLTGQALLSYNIFIKQQQDAID